MKKIFLAFTMLVFLNFCFCTAFSFNFYEDELISDSVYLADKISETPLVEKNIHKRRSPASLTKIMTFIIVYENCLNDLTAKVKVKDEVLNMVDSESSGCKLKEGEEFTINDLLHCMMISSSGYAAMVLADHIGGNIENFVNMMNEKARELGCENTNFINPDGIYSESQYSTAFDIYLITKYAMNNPMFLNIVSKSEHFMFGDERDPVITTNHMIDKKRGGKYYLPWVKGIKTGYLDDAGRCLVSYAEKNNESYVAVVMGGPTCGASGNKHEDNMAMKDSASLYRWVFGNLQHLKLYERGFPISETALDFAWERDTLLLAPQEDIKPILPLYVCKEDIIVRCNIPGCVEAPVKTGQKIGYADMIYKEQKIGSFDLVATQNFKKSYILVGVKFLKIIARSLVFKIFLALLLVFIFAYTYLLIKYKRRQKRRNKIKHISKFKKRK